MSRMTDYEAALKHKYRVEADGPYVPGVTTVINILDKPGLKWSASKIAAEAMYDRLTSGGSQGRDLDVSFARGAFDRQWKAKAVRGNRVHEVAELWVKGETVDVLDEDAGYVDALENFYKACKPNILFSERVVLNRWREYGGRFDFIGELDGHGLVLGDFKTGGEYPYEVALQAAGYLDCQLAEYDEHGSLWGLEVLPPEIVGARTVYLREDGSFKVSNPFEVVSQEDATLAFQACLELYKINKKINALIKKGNENEEAKD